MKRLSAILCSVAAALFLAGCGKSDSAGDLGDAGDQGDAVAGRNEQRPSVISPPPLPTPPKRKGR